MFVFRNLLWSKNSIDTSPIGSEIGLILMRAHYSQLLDFVVEDNAREQFGCQTD